MATWRSDQRGNLTAALGAVSSSLGTAACSSAPSMVAFGAFFPSWLLCLIVGVVVALLAHVALVRTGLNEVVPLQLVLCVSLGVIAAVLLSLIWLAD